MDRANYSTRSRTLCFRPKGRAAIHCYCSCSSSSESDSETCVKPGKNRKKSADFLILMHRGDRAGSNNRPLHVRRLVHTFIPLLSDSCWSPLLLLDSFYLSSLFSKLVPECSFLFFSVLHGGQLL